MKLRGQIVRPKTFPLWFATSADEVYDVRIKSCSQVVAIIGFARYSMEFVLRVNVLHAR